MVEYCSVLDETRLAQSIPLCLTMDLDHNLLCQVTFAKGKKKKKSSENEAFLSDILITSLIHDIERKEERKLILS